MNVDAVFDQDAEYTFVIAIARQAPADAIRLNDPQSERLAPPDRLRAQAAHLHHGEQITVLRDPLDQLIQSGLESSDFFNIIVFGHELRLGLVQSGW